MRVSLVTSPHLDHSSFAHSRSDVNGRLAQTFVPMGLISIAATVDRSSHVHILDINKAINSQRLPMSDSFYDVTAEWILETQPDMVGFMTEADSYHHLLRILQSIKNRMPSITTVLGGVHATAVHYETIMEFAAVDLIIRGEGELAFPNLVRALIKSDELSTVSNLTYRDKSLVRSTSDAPLIHNLDELPFPQFEKLQIEKEDAIYLEIGRGCPFKCNFCFTAPYWKRKHRIKTPTRIIQEIDYLSHHYGRTDLNFTHDLFTTDREWVIRFCKEIVSKRVSVTWTCSSRTDTLDEEQLYWMKAAGCRDIYFGVETGTAEMQKRIEKNLDLARAREIIAETVRSGVGVTVGFIAGLPGESAASLRGTLDEAFHYLHSDNSTVHLFGFCPYRGSPHFEKIVHSLDLDDQFIDFPLGEDAHLQNHSLMARHFVLFSRYGRLRDLSISRDILRAAEEYFPIMNALKTLMTYLLTSHRDIDSLNLLESWCDWISTEDSEGEISNLRIQGTIGDFLRFLPGYLAERGWLDAVAEELIAWEAEKHLLRTAGSQRGKTLDTLISNTLRPNPSVRLRHFRHAPKLLVGQEPGLFAFYLRRNGNPSIARLGEVSGMILQLAQNGIDLSDLLNGLHCTCSIPRESLRQVASVMEELKGQDLVLH
jgi:radical SAM superfamily enzyme YgiQ (UPF0313 family)